MPNAGRGAGEVVGGGCQTKYIAYTKLNSGERQRTAGGKTPFHPRHPPWKSHPLRRKKTKQCIKKVKVKLFRIRGNMISLWRRSKSWGRSWNWSRRRGIQSHSLSWLYCYPFYDTCNTWAHMAEAQQGHQRHQRLRQLSMSPDAIRHPASCICHLPPATTSPADEAFVLAFFPVNFCKCNYMGGSMRSLLLWTEMQTTDNKFIWSSCVEIVKGKCVGSKII